MPRPSTVDADLWQVAEAEARGDAAGALRALDESESHSDPLHRDDLVAVADAGADAPAWLVDRWVARQVHRWARLVGGWRWDTAMTLGLGTTWWLASNAEPAALPPAYHAILGDDWVTRELAVHRTAGLGDFVRRMATPELLARTGTVRAWSSFAIQPYRLGDHGDGQLEVTPPAGGRTLAVVDRGTGSTYGAGAHVLGRLVPARGGPPGFETLPLLIDERTAEHVVAAGPPRRGDPVPWAPLLTSSRSPNAGFGSRRSVTWSWLVGCSFVRGDPTGHPPRPGLDVVT